MGAPGGARIGLDLVEVGRFRRALDRHPGLRVRLFTSAELAYCDQQKDPTLSLAARFAGKEAVGKLLGVGVSAWRDIEIVSVAPEDKPVKERVPEERAPMVMLHGGAARIAARLGIDEIAISLSHVESLAGACAVAGACPPEDMNQGDGVNGSMRTLFKRAAVFTPAQVRELDRTTIEELGVPGPVLMERAALGVTSLIRVEVSGTAYAGRLWHRQQWWGWPGHRQAVARRGASGGLRGLCGLCGRPYAGRCSQLPHRREGRGQPAHLGEVPGYLWDETELVVDCLLGTGSAGGLRGRTIEAARMVNSAGARGVPVLAVDVPSGVDAATGSLADGAVAADVTVTFHAAKSGLVCPPGSEAAGEVLVWDIGIPESLEPEPDLWVVTDDEVNVPGRRVDDHKYRAGYVAVLAGSTAYPGAAWLATQAAYMVGAGYVRLLMPAGAAGSVRDRLVEGVLQEVGPGDWLCDAGPVLEALADERLGALTVGPGLGRERGYDSRLCGGWFLRAGRRRCLTRTASMHSPATLSRYGTARVWYSLRIWESWRHCWGRRWRNWAPRTWPRRAGRPRLRSRWSCSRARPP